MHVIVVGCGRVGTRLALELSKTGHTVGVIDKNPTAFRRLPEGNGVAHVIGAGFDRDVLVAAGAEGAGALAAVTSGDNSNILSARIARENFEIPNVVARIYDPRRAEIYQRLGIPTVATVTWTTDQVMRKLVPDQTAAEWADPTGGICLIERTLPIAYCGKPLGEFEAETGARIVAINRRGVAELSSGDLIGQEGDILHLAVNFSSRAKIEGLFAVRGSEAQ